MPEREAPQFSNELLEKLTTTAPIDLLTEEERQRLHDYTQATEKARLETRRIIQTLYLD